MPLITILLLLVSSCGGGGGGGGSGASVSSSSEEIIVTPDIWTNEVTEAEANNYRTTEYNRQYGLEAINAAKAYALLEKNAKSVGGDGVLIAVNDSGARITHQDVEDNIDNSLNKNFVDADPDDVNDTNGHGTHTMTTAAGVKNDAGMHGVAFNATTFAVEIIGYASETGVEYSADSGAKVANMSWGYGGYYNCDGTTTCGFAQVVNEMLAAKDEDMLMAISTGNDADQRGDGQDVGDDPDYLLYNNPGSPALFANHPDLAGYVLAVGALEQYNDTYRVADFSNSCGVTKEYCLTAPGVNIYAGFKNNDSSYAYYNGTSMAAPHVAGAAAVIRGAWSFLTAPQVAEILLDTATDLGDAGVDDIYGHGMLNLYAAVQAQGQNNFSFGTSVSQSAYDLRNSNMTTSPIFGSSIRDNILPQLSNAVFFDKYGRDYKANLAKNVEINQTGVSPSLNNIILSNISYQNLPLNFGSNSNVKMNFNLASYKNSQV